MTPESARPSSSEAFNGWAEIAAAPEVQLMAWQVNGGPAWRIGYRCVIGGAPADLVIATHVRGKIV